MSLKLFLIPLCAFYINFCTFGYMRSGGVLYMSFIKEFNCTYAEASWPTVLIGSFASFSIFVAAFLTHYFESRSIIAIGILLSATAIGLSALVTSIKWIIFLSAIQGIGNGFFVGLLPIIISEYFDKGRSIACGLSYCGCTVAAFLFPPLLQIIIENFHLKIALAILSLIAYSALFAAWPFKSIKISGEQTSLTGNSKRHTLINQLINDFEVVKLLPFWTVTVIYVIFIYVFVIFIIILPDLAVSRGLDEHSAAMLLSIYSIGDLLGRLIPGYLHLKNLVYNQTFYLYSIILMAVLFVLIKFYAISFSIFAILCFALGFVTGIQMTLPAVVMVEFIGVQKAKTGFGLSNILSGLIALTRPLLIEYIKSSTQHYDNLLIINGILCLLAIFPWLYLALSSCEKMIFIGQKVLHRQPEVFGE